MNGTKTWRDSVRKVADAFAHCFCVGFRDKLARTSRRSCKQMRIRSCFLLVLSLGLGTTSAEVLWYGGDSIGGPNGGFINNTRVPGVGFSFSVLDDFVVPGDPWHVTALFSNNSGSSQTPPPITEATWSVRIGASPNDRGHILFSGVSPASASPTGRVEGLEYQIVVSDLSFNLAPGIYFMQVSPVASVPNYYIGISDGTNAIGISGPSGLLLESFETDPPRIGSAGRSGTGSASMG